jgi:two-component system cell cycle sensor histidine kinase/response regulator CckA
MQLNGEKRVLVVDDEAIIRAMLRAVLVGMGYEVMEACSGNEGLDVAATNGPFALVVSDIMMPGIDGIEMARRIAGAGSAGRFLFISGYCDSEQVGARLAGMPASAFLGKPFAIADLMRTVQRLVAGQAVPPRSASTP